MPIWGNRIVMTTDPIKLQENKKIAKENEHLLSTQIEKMRERRKSLKEFQHDVENLKRKKSIACVEKSPHEDLLQPEHPVHKSKSF